MLLQISGVGKICKKRFGAQIHSHELKKKRLSIIYIYILRKSILQIHNDSNPDLCECGLPITSIIQWFHKIEYL